MTPTTRRRPGIAAGLRRGVRALVQPRPGIPRRIPVGFAEGIRLEGEDEPSLDQWLGLFESELAADLRRFCLPGARCVDVGCWNAYYALSFARRSGGPVRTYEPDRVAVARARRNLALNPGLAGQIELREVAAGARPDPETGTVPLDEDLAGWGPPDLVKIDVEGAEHDVLLGAERVLAEHRPHVVVETHAPELERACGDLLLAHGYRPTVVLPRRLLPQNRPREHNRWLVAAA